MGFYPQLKQILWCQCGIFYSQIGANLRSEAHRLSFTTFKLWVFVFEQWRRDGFIFGELR